jgi:hypothetical protein
VLRYKVIWREQYAKRNKEQSITPGTALRFFGEPLVKLVVVEVKLDKPVLEMYLGEANLVSERKLFEEVRHSFVGCFVHRIVHFLFFR